jgi:hypothetical protein
LIKAATTWLISLGLALPVSAHHSRSNFDFSQPVRLSGVVTEFRWGNPHLYIRVRDDDGRLWLVEGHSIPGVVRLGWSRGSVLPGERILLGAYPDRDHPHKFVLLDWLVNHEGLALKAFAASQIPAEVVARKAPLENPAQVSPSLDFSGNWTVDFSGVDLRVSGFSPARDWPLTAAGMAQATHFDLKEDPVLDCTPRALPQVLKSAYGYRFDRFADRLVMAKEHDDSLWTIWFDAGEAEEIEPSRFGRSLGQITGRTLTFTTDRFTADKWGLTRGIDSSADKIVKATYILADDGLSIDFTYELTDPEYLLAPVRVSGRLLKEADRLFVDVPCTRENARLHLVGE